MAYKTFVNGVELPASDLNTYLMKQTVMVFASAAARDAAITAAEGMVVYLQDTNLLYVYDGAAWGVVSNTAAWTVFTPTVSSGLTVGNGVWSAAYMQIGKTVHLRIRFTFGTTSAVTGQITLGLPVTAGAASYSAGLMLAGGANYPSNVVTGTSTLNIYAQNAAGTYLTRANTSATIPGTWTTSDAFNLSTTYEAA